MADFQLNWVSTDITEDVLSYTRDAAICEGTRNINVEVVNTGRAYTNWDSLTLWEDTNKVGKFYIREIKSKHDNSIVLSCQDSSLKLLDHFEERIWNPGYVSNAKYWISLWLDRVGGVSYNFKSSGSGAILNKDVTFGRDSTYNLIVPLLQQSNWYMIFDENDVLQIGELDIDSKSVSASYDETDITEITFSKRDTQCRNRVVVWGGRDITTDTWISGEAEADASWQIDSNDDRTVLISSNMIKNYGSAYLTANKLLNSVIDLVKEKEVVLTGFRNRDVGDLVHIKSEIFNGNGLITDIQVTASNTGGYTTTLTLDRRCPRLFAYFAWDGYVYVGTRGGGVYRKPFETSTWSSYNSGLTNLNIKDLYINNGIYVCITGDGYAYRSTDATGYWVKLSHGEMTDSEESVYEESEIEAVACAIDDEGSIIVGYNHKTEDLAWMIHYNIYSGIERKEQVIVDGTKSEIKINDLDNTGEVTVIATAGEISGTGEGLIVRNWDLSADTHKDSTGYYSDSSGILDADYTDVSVNGHIKGIYGDYGYNCVYTGAYHATAQKILLASGTVVASIDIYSDGGGLILGTYIAGFEPHVISEDLIIIPSSYQNYFYQLDFSTETASQYAPKAAGTLSYALATSSGDFYYLYNTDSYDRTYYYDGVDPEQWYLQINNDTPIQLIVDDDDWQIDGMGGGYYCITPEGDFPVTYVATKDQLMLGLWEGVDGSAIIPCIETNGVYCYTSEYGDPYGTPFGYDSLSFNMGLIAFKTIVVSDGEASQSEITDVLVTKNDELCFNYQADLVHKTYRNLYAYSTIYNSIVPDYSGSGGIMAFIAIRTYAVGCQPGVGEYGDTMYLWSQWFSDKYLTGTTEYNYFFMSFFGIPSEVLEIDDPTVDPLPTVLGQGNQGVWFWSDDDYSFHSVTGGITGTPASGSSLTIDPKSCDITGNYIAVNANTQDLCIIDSNLNMNVVMELDVGEGNAELLGNSIFTDNRILYNDGEVANSEISITAGTVVKDLYYTADNLPSGSDMFVTILQGINGFPKVEISRTTPTIIYTVPGVSYVHSNFTLDVDDWNNLGSAYRIPMADARIYFSDDGESAFDGFKVAVATNSENIYSGNARLDEEFQVVFSGAIVTSGSQPLHRIETSNGVVPYFFASTSGSPTSASQFFQKNDGSNVFTEYSTGLPANGITIIRLDDRIS